MNVLEKFQFNILKLCEITAVTVSIIENKLQALAKPYLTYEWSDIHT